MRHLIVGGVKLPQIDTSVLTRGHEASIVLVPIDASDVVVASFEEELWWGLSRVEFIDHNIRGALTGEVLSAVRKLDFPAVFD